MKSEETNTTVRIIPNHSIPEEIIIEILSKLPVKSLLRLKCVSRSWRSLISTKHLIKTHLKNSTKNGNLAHHMITSQSPFSKNLRACSLHSLLIEEPVATVLHRDFPMNNSNGAFRVLGSCNGLVCIFVHFHNLFFLWNPSTRESKQLPPIYTGYECRTNYFSHANRYGFGFDDSSGDYKVFAGFNGFSGKFFGRLYSLKADSWGDYLFFKDNKSPFDSKVFEAGKFASGKLHWRSNKLGTKPKWEIVCLDIKSEILGFVEQPSCLEGSFCPRLVVLRGCLCVCFDHPEDISTIGLDIWIWNEYGVEDSWTKFATVSYLHDSWRGLSRSHEYCFTPLCILPNGEILLAFIPYFFVYCPKDNCFIRKRYIVDFDYFCEAHAYIESLVSLVLDDDDQQGRQL